MFFERFSIFCRIHYTWPVLWRHNYRFCAKG